MSDSRTPPPPEEVRRAMNMGERYAADPELAAAARRLDARLAPVIAAICARLGIDEAAALAGLDAGRPPPGVPDGPSPLAEGSPGARGDKDRGS